MILQTVDLVLDTFADCDTRTSGTIVESDEKYAVEEPFHD